MLNIRSGRYIVLFFAWAAAASHAEAQTCFGELCPGRIWDPPAFQWDIEGVYVPTRDEYFVATTEWTFTSGGLVGRFLDPNGAFTGSVTTLLAGGNQGVTDVEMAYNEDRDEILLIARDASPQSIRALYLGSDGQPISTVIGIGVGNAPSVAYSPDSQRYLVTWSKRDSGVDRTFYLFLDGDSTNPSPILGSGTIDSGSLSDVLAYSTVSQKFLVVYTKENRNADIYGRFISATGTLGSPFPIDNGSDDQQVARVAYAPSTNRFMVIYEDWSKGSQLANIKARLVSSSGSITATNTLVATKVWDTPGPIGYNSATDTFIATWRTASNSAIAQRAQEFRPTDGTAKGSAVLISPHDAGLTSLATRPDPAGPSVLILWWQKFGLDGVRAGIMDLPPAPPEIQSPMPEGFFQVPYGEQIPVAGGTLPLDYEFLNGTEVNLPAGLSPAGDFATSGMVEGTPTSMGTSGTLTVRVTDDDGRSDEANLTLTISLQPPTALEPSGSLNIAKPTFDWTETPGATSYDIEAENLTDGGIVIGTNVTSPPFTPTTALSEPKQYRWRVRALGSTSAWSDWLAFDIEMTPPAQVDLMVLPPTAFVPVAAVNTTASSQISASRRPDQATDGDPSTFWSSAARTVQTDEFITADLGSIKTVSRVRIRSRQSTAATFPVDFLILTSLDNAAFQTAQTVPNFSASSDTEYFFPITPTQARYVTIFVTKVNRYSDGKYYTQLAELGVDEGSAASQSLLIQWFAPGDDGNTGTASSYELVWSFTPVDSMNFHLATPVPVVLGPPKPPGELEAVLFDGLLDETTYYLGLKVFDDAGNFSLDTDFGITKGIPPAQIQTLAASNPQLDSVDLEWSPVGDNGMIGRADHYEIAFATFPIDDANFNVADKLPPAQTPSPPRAPGGPNDTAVVDGLQHTTDYYFAVRVFDDKGNFSTSNVVMQPTLDDTPPASVELTGSSGSVVPSMLSGVTAVASSGEINSNRSMDKTIDGDLESFWSTPGRVAHQQEFIRWSLGSVKPLTRVRLRTRSNSGELFPVDYSIDVSLDGNMWSTVAAVTGTSLGAAKWVQHDFPPADALFVRVFVTQAALYPVNGQFYTQISEAELYEAQTVGNAVTVRWTAPGDNGVSGSATEYHFCYSTNEAEVFTNFCSNAPAQSTLIQFPVSGPSGTPESRDISSLPDETRYYIALESEDDSGNPSDISTPDGFFLDTPGTAPAAVSNLRFTDVQGTSIVATWQASGDDGTTGGLADEYLFCYSTAPIDAANFCAGPGATLLNLPVAAAFPAEESYPVMGLQSETTYYVGIVVEDELDNASPLSNVIFATTPDIVPPAPVTDFAAAAGQVAYTQVPLTAVAASGEANATRSKEKAVDSDTSSFWTTPGRSTMQDEFLIVDAGSARSLGQVRLRSRDATGSLFPIDFEIQTALVDAEASYQTQVTVTGFSTPAGKWSLFPFPAPVNAQFVRLKVTMPALYAPNNSYYVQLSEFAVDEAALSDEVTLTWKASGDNGTTGIATSYGLCYSENQNDVTVDFCQTSGTFETLPVGGGYLTDESRTLSGLSGETMYYFGIEARDEASNPSTRAFTNVMTPAVPPSPVSDFMVTGQTTGSVSLSWKASGNDGMLGQADHYDLCVSTSAIDEMNFCGGTLIVRPVTGIAGTNESYTVGSLDEDTSYYFGIRVDDGNGGLSTLTVLTAKTSDATAPQIAPDFSVAPLTVAQQATVMEIASSGDINTTRAKEKVLDGDVTSFWSSPARAVAQDEFLILDLGSSRTVTGVRMRSRNATGALFPEDFVLQTSLVDVDGSYVTQVMKVGFGATSATWYDFAFPSPVTARFVRLKITKSRQYIDTNFYAQLSEVIVDEDLVHSDKLLVSWKAPHENEASGGAAQTYIMRIDTSPVSSTTDGQAVSGTLPGPGAPGTDESFVVEGLAPGTTYYIGLWSEDDVGMVSLGAFGNATTGP